MNPARGGAPDFGGPGDVTPAVGLALEARPGDPRNAETEGSGDPATFRQTVAALDWSEPAFIM